MELVPIELENIDPEFRVLFMAEPYPDLSHPSIASSITSPSPEDKIIQRKLNLLTFSQLKALTYGLYQKKEQQDISKLYCPRAYQTKGAFISFLIKYKDFYLADMSEIDMICKQCKEHRIENKPIYDRRSTRTHLLINKHIRICLKLYYLFNMKLAIDIPAIRHDYEKEKASMGSYQNEKKDIVVKLLHLDNIHKVSKKEKEKETNNTRQSIYYR